MTKNIRDIIEEVNESLTDSQELTGTQRNALMLIHLITNVDDIAAKIVVLEGNIKTQNDKFDTLERRVKVLEDNSIAAIMLFVKDNWKLVIGIFIAIFSALGGAPEIIKILAVLAGLDIK